ncbi:MAG: hypothetical protein GY953_20465, partial [bacterium]|nr:hypothetical protein [bacterium]
MVRRDEHENSLESEMRQYMLGQLSERDEQRFDERVMSDDEALRQVEELSEVVQDEMVEDYVSGTLNDDDRTAFEQRLLGSSKVRDKLPLSQALVGLRKHKAEAPNWRQRIQHWMQPVLQPAPAALAASLLIAAVAGGTWSV